MTSSTVADTEGIHVVRFNPLLRQNYFIFMRNFQKNQHKISNYQVQFSNRTLCKFQSPEQEILDPPLLLLFILFYLHGPAHMGPYGSHIDC